MKFLPFFCLLSYDPYEKALLFVKILTDFATKALWTRCFWLDGHMNAPYNTNVMTDRSDREMKKSRRNDAAAQRTVFLKGR